MVVLQQMQQPPPYTVETVVPSHAQTVGLFGSVAQVQLGVLQVISSYARLTGDKVPTKTSVPMKSA